MSDSNNKSLLLLLADGELHSGEELGGALGVSRAAIWKRLQSLAQLGVVVESVKGLGYRIPGGLSLLDGEIILSALINEDCPINKLSCFDEINSTNDFLLKGLSSKGDVCLAERQSAGRGRRGRSWFSPFGKNLYMSVCWHYDQGVSVLEGLSLAVGVVLVDVLQELGCLGVQLKWPNDILISDGSNGAMKKLGGVLVEVGGDLAGECKVVVGIGLNVCMSDVVSADARQQISQPWSDMKQAGYQGDRNSLVASVLSKLLPALEGYAEQGFSHYQERWQQSCAYREQTVELHFPSRVKAGVLKGVDSSGALILKGLDGTCESFNGGEVSLRTNNRDH